MNLMVNITTEQSSTKSVSVLLYKHTMQCCDTQICTQDFEALTPNLLARTIETVEGGGIVVLLLSTLTSLTQLFSLTMDVHSRLRTESHQDVTGEPSSSSLQHSSGSPSRVNDHVITVMSSRLCDQHMASVDMWTRPPELYVSTKSLYV